MRNGLMKNRGVGYTYRCYKGMSKVGTLIRLGRRNRWLLQSVW